MLNRYIKHNFWLLLFVTLGCLKLSASNIVDADTLKYRIMLRDKAATTYNLLCPQKFLSQRAIERRLRQHIVVDSTDLPICKKYIKDILGTGVHIVARGKWNNFVTVSCNDPSILKQIKTFPFVMSVEKVWQYPRKTIKNVREVCNRNAAPATSKNRYGLSWPQIHLCNGDYIHSQGYKGKGMHIAIIDAGYENVDSIVDMRNIRILGTRDFVQPGGNVFSKGSHGTSVLSIMAMNKPYFMVGTAPEASYWLLCSEDEGSENLVEQDYWAEAVEFADSVGVDVVNSSIGYYTFDDSIKNYKHEDLNGRYALITRQASMAAGKGMVVVVSAGNEGGNKWRKITFPADADHVIAVGSTNAKGNLSWFSSVGNTTDGRIKPDVTADGECTIMQGTGVPFVGFGTSFASPLICGLATCLWQAYPQLTANEVIMAMRESGNKALRPDNMYGYGIPNMRKAMQEALIILKKRCKNQ